MLFRSGAYPVAKGGVLNLTRVAAVELAPHGIRVNSVTPTQSGQPLGYGYQADVLERSGPARSIPLGRWGRPEDTMGVAWLRNVLSRERRDFLAAGGISYFIGDGSLRYRPEDIVETYYSHGVGRGDRKSTRLNSSH